MTVEPGRRLGEGRTADVYEYGNGRVVKVLKPGLPVRLPQLETEATETAARAGAPAPRVHGLVEVEGRPGVVFDRVSGDGLVDLLAARVDRWRYWADLLAHAHADILDRTTTELVDVRDLVRSNIWAAEPISNRQREAALGALETLDGGRSLLHGDFHPLNVFVTGEEWRVIDWVNASRGPVAADVARTICLLHPAALPPDLPHREDFVELLPQFEGVYRETVLGLTGVENSEVERWMLPVFAARLSEGIEWETETIMSRIDELIG